MANVATLLGTPFMPWQRYVADVAGEVDSDGRLWYREVRLTIPRQSGKTTEVLAQIVDRCFNRRRQGVSYTAQTRLDARKKWQDEWKPLIQETPFARSVRWRLTNGQEAMLWKTGSIQDLMATTRKSGHGPPRDMGVIDEAFAQEDDRVEQAMSPSMITRPEPQLWVVSTAGDERSGYLRAKVDSGRAIVESGKDERIAYFEWSAPEDADPFDEAVWWACMPALGLTTPIDAVRFELHKMAADGKLDEFRRAYLNQWVKRGKVDALPGWSDREDPRSRRGGTDLVLAIDAAPGLASCAVGLCTRNRRGQHHVELVAHEEGSGWLAGKLAALVKRRNPRGVAFASSAPVASLVPQLKAAGLTVRSPANPTGALVALSTADVAKGSLLLADEVRDGKVVHIGQAALNTAVDGAERRQSGDGGFLWHRAGSSVDISPLVAVTEALWGFETFEAPVVVDISTQIW